MKPYFQQDNVTIYHGDCRDLIADLGKVGMVLTDPPYARSGNRGEWKVTASVAIGLHMAARGLRDGGVMMAFTTSSGRGQEFTLSAVGNVLPFNRTLVWHKEFVRSRVAGPWRWDTVFILAFGRASFGRPEYSSVFTTSGPAARSSLGLTGHCAELPEGLADWLYTPFSGQPGIVLDPFCGSGQLLVPAAREGRQVIGVDIEEEHCDTAARVLMGTPLKLRASAGQMTFVEEVA